MNSKSLFYEESTQLNPQGILLGLLLGLGLSSILAYVYTLLVVSIPLIYFGVAINILMGFLLGLIIRVISKLTHNRNKKSQYIISFATSLAFTYFQWLAFVLYALNEVQIISVGDFYNNLALILIAPSSFFEPIGLIFEHGLWGVFGITFTGILLALVWLAETAVILFLPLIFIYKAKVFPYSEKFGKWYPKYTLDEDFKLVHSSGKILGMLRKGVLESLEELGNGKSDRHTKVHLYYIEQEQFQYIDFESVIIDREGKIDQVLLVENYKLDKALAKKILATFDHKTTVLAVV